MEHNVCYELFLNAKDKINSITPDYHSALEELNKIDEKSITMCIEHMKIICLYMLNQQESIVEYYYTHKREVIGYCERNEELRKLLAAAFYTCGMRRKAKEFYDINEQYHLSTFDMAIISNKEPIPSQPIVVHEEKKKKVIELSIAKEVDIELQSVIKSKSNDDSPKDNANADVEGKNKEKGNEEQSNQSMNVKEDASEKNDVNNKSINYDSKSQCVNENKMNMTGVSIPKPRSEREIPLSGSNNSNKVIIRKSDPELGNHKGKDNNKSITPDKPEENNIRHARTTHIPMCANKRLQQLELEEHPDSVRAKKSNPGLKEVHEINQVDTDKELMIDQLKEKDRDSSVKDNKEQASIKKENKDEEIIPKEEKDKSDKQDEDIKIIPLEKSSNLIEEPQGKIDDNKDLSLFNDKIQYKEGTSEIINQDESITNPVISSPVIEQNDSIKPHEEITSSLKEKDKDDDIAIIPSVVLDNKPKEEEENHQVETTSLIPKEEEELSIKKIETNNTQENNTTPLNEDKEPIEAPIATKESNTNDDIIKVNDLDISSPKENIVNEDKNLPTDKDKEDNKSKEELKAIDQPEAKQIINPSNPDLIIAQNTDQAESNHETINNDPLRSSNVIGDRESRKEEEKFEIIANEEVKDKDNDNDDDKNEGNTIQDKEEEVIHSSRKTDINPMISSEFDNKEKEEPKPISVDEIIKEDEKKETNEEKSIDKDNKEIDEKNEKISDSNKDGKEEESIKEDKKEEEKKEEEKKEEEKKEEEKKEEEKKEEEKKEGIMLVDTIKTENNHDEGKEIDNGNKEEDENKEKNDIKSDELIKEEHINDNDNQDIIPILNKNADNNIEQHKEDDNIEKTNEKENEIPNEEIKPKEEEIKQDDEIQQEEEVKIIDEKPKDDLKQNEEEIKEEPTDNPQEINKAKDNDENDEFDVDNNIPLPIETKPLPDTPTQDQKASNNSPQAYQSPIHDDIPEEALKDAIEIQSNDIPEEALKDAIQILSNDILVQANHNTNSAKKDYQPEESVKPTPLINEDDTQAIIKQIKTDPLIDNIDQSNPLPQSHPTPLIPPPEIKDPSSTPLIKKEIPHLSHANTITTIPPKPKADAVSSSKIKFEPFNYNMENIQKFLPKSKTNITHKIILKTDKDNAIQATSKPSSDRLKKNP